MDETKIKHVIEAALLAAGKPLPFDKLASLFATKAAELDKETLQRAIDALAADYSERGLELKEVASGFRIQIKSSMSEWLIPLWEERAPRYTRALLETLALVAYRQPITRAEIEEVRGVAVSTNIMRTLLERSWVRVVGHRDVPGKPAMFGTTREFLDYFGLKKLEDLPPLADIKDGLPELHPQTDLIEALHIGDDSPDGQDEIGIETEPRPDTEPKLEPEDAAAVAGGADEQDADLATASEDVPHTPQTEEPVPEGDAESVPEADAESDNGGDVQVIVANSSATADDDDPETEESLEGSDLRAEDEAEAEVELGDDPDEAEAEDEAEASDEYEAEDEADLTLTRSESS